MMCFKITFNDGKISWIKYCSAETIADAVERSNQVYSPKDKVSIIAIERVGAMM